MTLEAMKNKINDALSHTASWDRSPAEISAIVAFAKTRKPVTDNKYDQKLLDKLAKHGVIEKKSDGYYATAKARELVAEWKNTPAPPAPPAPPALAPKKANKKAKEAAPEAPAPAPTPKAKEAAPEAPKERRIRLVKTDMPTFQNGSQRSFHWPLLRNGMTVAEYLKAGGASHSLAYFEKRKWVVTE